MVDESAARPTFMRETGFNCFHRGFHWGREKTQGREKTHPHSFQRVHSKALNNAGPIKNTGTVQ